MGTLPAARNSGSIGVLKSHLPSPCHTSLLVGASVVWPVGFPPTFLPAISFAVPLAGFPPQETFMIAVPISNCIQSLEYGTEMP